MSSAVESRSGGNIKEERIHPADKSELAFNQIEILKQALLNRVEVREALARAYLAPVTRYQPRSGSYERGMIVEVPIDGARYQIQYSGKEIKNSPDRYREFLMIERFVDKPTPKGSMMPTYEAERVALSLRTEYVKHRDQVLFTRDADPHIGISAYSVDGEEAGEDSVLSHFAGWKLPDYERKVVAMIPESFPELFPQKS